MGKTADDIINGKCCALCGQYFISPVDYIKFYSHGYPVACDDCFNDICGYPKAIANTI